MGYHLAITLQERISIEKALLKGPIAYCQYSNKNASSDGIYTGILIYNIPVEMGGNKVAYFVSRWNKVEVQLIETGYSSLMIWRKYALGTLPSPFSE